MSNEVKQEILTAAEKSIPFMKVSVKLEIFGHTLFEWSWPPKSK